MAAAPDSAAILTFEDARHLVEEHARRLRPRGKQLVGLLDSLGHVLAETVAADRDFPPFRRAARDGYAVRAADVQSCPVALQIVGEIKAGAETNNLPAIGQGQAAAIMTGAPAPAGADAVVMVEYTQRKAQRVEIHQPVAPDANIVPVGSEARRGESLLTSGMRLEHSAVAIAASVGKSRLLVYSPPRIAVLATGDEVVDIDVPPGPTQIRNSNSYSLAAQIRAAGGIPILLPIAPDEPKRLRELIAEGLESDLLLLAGGVSAGQYDLVEQALAERHAEFFFTGVQIQPGKPVVFGRVASPGGTKYFFGLPGNPVSTMVTFELFVKAILQALAGMTSSKLVFLRARLKSEIKTKTGLKRFLPAILSGEFEQAEVELARWQGSGDIAALAKANCFIVVPPDRERIAPGEWVPVLMK